MSRYKTVRERQCFRFIIQAPVRERQEERGKKKEKMSRNTLNRDMSAERENRALWENSKIFHVNRPIPLSIVNVSFRSFLSAIFLANVPYGK